MNKKLIAITIIIALIIIMIRRKKPKIVGAVKPILKPGSTIAPNPAIPPVIRFSWVQYPNGLKVYDRNGNVTNTPVTIKLEGENNNILTATSNLQNQGAYEVRYALDSSGNWLDQNNNGWKLGLPNQLVMPADGRVHCLFIGLIGDVWGGNASTNKMHNLYQVFFKVGGSSNLPNAVSYPSTFNPEGNTLLPKFFDQFPDFQLPNKVNAYAGAMPRAKCSFDMRKRGFTAWELRNEALTLYPNTLNHRTDYDGCFRNIGWTNAGFINDPNVTQVQAEALAVTYMNSNTAPDKGVYVADNEWFQGVPLNHHGKLMFKYFWEKSFSLSPNTKLFAHHMRPYNFPSEYYMGTKSIQDIAKVFHSDYTLNQLYDEYVNVSDFAQYWADIAGLQRGNNGGAFLNISVSAYVSQWNDASRLYAIAQELFINKKFFPNKKVCATIQASTEVSVSNQDGVFTSWSYDGGGETEILNPMLAPNFTESVAMLGNFIADGVISWGENEIVQEEDPSVFYAFHSQLGIPEGNTDSQKVQAKGKFAKQYQGCYDYLVAGMYKYSKIQNLSNVFLPEISIDGTTWLTGDDVTPVFLLNRKRPMAFAMQSQGKTAVLVLYPYNRPEQRFDFKVRVNGQIIDVSVNGQFPEIFIV